MKKYRWLLCAMLTGICIAVSGCGSNDSGAYDRGMEALEQKQYTKACQEFENAAKNDGREAEAYRGEGIAALEQKQYEEALELFTRSLEAVQGGNSAFQDDVKLYQAEAMLGMGDTEQAESLCEELLTGSRKGDAELLLGRIVLQNGDTELAEEYFSESAGLLNNYETYLCIYDLYVSVNMEANGAAYLQKALQLEPSDGETYYLQGLIYYDLEDYENARTSLTSAIDLGNTDAISLIGRIYLDSGDIEGARSLFQSYLDQGIRPALEYNGLALCDIKENNFAGAMEEIQKGLEEDDAEVRESLLYNEIAVYEDQLDFQTAKEKMQSFLEEYPDNEEAQRENIFLQSR